jgi:hypothetical protein
MVNNLPLAMPPAPDMLPIVEDYSDLTAGEDEQWLDKLADFKVGYFSAECFFSSMVEQVKNSLRRGLFHPDDIKTVGLTSTSPGPMSAPLPGLARKSSRPSLTPIVAVNGPSFGSQSGRGSHSRSSSFAGAAGSSGSVGRSEARRTLSQTEFGKYTEEDDEDYEDVFGKPNGTGAAEHSMQTLQLNTRLSNKSWVSREPDS